MAELEIHQAVLDRLRVVLPLEAARTLLHVPNLPRNKVAGAILKSMGMRAGAADLHIACKRIEDAYRQPDLFVPAPPAPIQISLTEFGDA